LKTTLEGGAFGERALLDDCEIIGEGNALEGVTVLEGAFADSLEAFVTDDELETEAVSERPRFDDSELIRESDARESGAILECSHS